MIFYITVLFILLIIVYIVFNVFIKKWILFSDKFVSLRRGSVKDNHTKELFW